MKKVFLDTNVLLDFITGRDGFEEASAILQLGEDSKAILATSILSMANTAYVAQKGRTKEELYELLQGLSEIMHTLSMNENQLLEALSIIAPDFEDMLQYVCAKEHQCDAIITRNKKDFPYSTIPIYSPIEFLQTPYYWTEESNNMLVNEPETIYQKSK